MWAREFFVTALVLAAALVVLEETISARRQVGWTAALLAAACGIKLTAAIPAAAIVFFIALVQRRPLRAAAAALATGALALSLFAFCYWRYGFEFVFQGFIFHFVKGADGAGAGPTYPATILDVLVPLFVLGVARLAATRPADRALAMVLALLVPSYLFYSFVSPTAWGHNYLEPLPCIAIVAGAGAAWLLDAYRTSWLKLGGGPRPGRGEPDLDRAALGRELLARQRLRLWLHPARGGGAAGGGAAGGHRAGRAR